MFKIENVIIMQLLYNFNYGSIFPNRDIRNVSECEHKICSGSDIVISVINTSFIRINQCNKYVFEEHFVALNI